MYNVKKSIEHETKWFRNVEISDESLKIGRNTKIVPSSRLLTFILNAA